MGFSPLVHSSDVSAKAEDPIVDHDLGGRQGQYYTTNSAT